MKITAKRLKQKADEAARNDPAAPQIVAERTTETDLLTICEVIVAVIC